MRSPSTRLPTPEGPRLRLASAAPPGRIHRHVPSRYIDTGELRLHAVIGGDGPPLLLVARTSIAVQ